MRRGDSGSTERTAASRTNTLDRGLSPVVGKTLELGVGVLFVALLTTTLFGGLAPDYRDAVGAELGERTLVAAAERTEAAVPDGDVLDHADAVGVEGTRFDRRVSLRLPTSIRDDPYRIAADSTADGSVVALVHPDPRIGGRVRLAIPDSLTVSGSVSSESSSWIHVTATGDHLIVRLADEDAVGDDTAAAGEMSPERLSEATP